MQTKINLVIESPPMGLELPGFIEQLLQRVGGGGTNQVSDPELTTNTVAVATNQAGLTPTN